MRLADLPVVTELAIRRAWLIERLEDLKRGNVVVSLGGQTIGGPGQASVSRTMGAALRVDIENNAQQLRCGRYARNRRRSVSSSAWAVKHSWERTFSV